MAEEAVDFKLFRYDPNLSAAVFFILLFTAAASLHTYQYIVTKTWFFTAFIVGCWCKSALASPTLSQDTNRSCAVEVIGFLTVRQILLTKRSCANSSFQESDRSRPGPQLHSARVLDSHNLRSGRSIGLRG
jgi:hypothetical protein